MVNVALRDPVAVGVKVTLIVQLVPPAMLEPQLLVWEKSMGSVPSTFTVSGRGVEVVAATFEIVTVRAALLCPTVMGAGKATVAGVTETAVPVPNWIEACWPLPLEKLPKTFKAAVSSPAAHPVDVLIKVG